MASTTRPQMAAQPALRVLIIGVIGFLTLADLFATQAILPVLATRFGVSPGAIGVAANAGTIGMAIAGLLAGVLAGDIDRRRGIWMSLALLAVPTTLLAFAPNPVVFALLRIAQGLCMATAFTLTITYLAEQCSPDDAATSLAAYVTGVVASNLVGRLIASTAVSLAGVATSFYIFAGLNLAGALLVRASLSSSAPMMRMHAPGHFWSAWATHLADARLRRCYAIGFLILFAFIGVFTYVGFVLAKPPLSVSMRSIGVIFLCFAPSMLTTPFAGQVASRYGAARVLPLSLVLAIGGLGLMLLPDVAAVFCGMVLVALGTFFAQAIATGFVGRVAMTEKAAASGLYLFFYYAGGLVGAVVVGQLFDQLGWSAAVIAGGVALTLGAVIGLGLRTAPPLNAH
ncbi:MAG: MFS transporter [Sphingomonas sp.]|nr:MFS transporter [Sphingomonas sp.]